MKNNKTSRRAVILTTQAGVGDEWNYRRIVSESSGIDFAVRSMSTGYGQSRLRNMWCFFVFPFIIFLQRRRYDYILASQQFYGLLLAFYCRLLGVRKTFVLVVDTFIYKPKRGLVGRIYGRFMRYVVGSGYVDRYIVRSSAELTSYQRVLGIPAERLTFIPLGLGGIGDAPVDQAMAERRYILSVGRSNRDYGFLTDALQAYDDHDVEIVCDTCRIEPRNRHIHIYRDIHGDELSLWMKNCYLVVIPLANREISSGHLVLLHAMMMGKPVVVTRSEAITDYFVDGETGIAIDNTPAELLAAIRRLYDDRELYERMSRRCRELFAARYSAEREAEMTGKVIKMRHIFCELK